MPILAGADHVLSCPGLPEEGLVEAMAVEAAAVVVDDGPVVVLAPLAQAATKTTVVGHEAVNSTRPHPWSPVACASVMGAPSLTKAGPRRCLSCAALADRSAVAEVGERCPVDDERKELAGTRYGRGQRGFHRGADGPVGRV